MICNILGLPLQAIVLMHWISYLANIGHV